MTLLCLHLMCTYMHMICSVCVCVCDTVCVCVYVQHPPKSSLDALPVTHSVVTPPCVSGGALHHRTTPRQRMHAKTCITYVNHSPPAIHDAAVTTVAPPLLLDCQCHCTVYT